MLKKFINTKLAYDEQKKYINGADVNDLIIIFSYTGNYFLEGKQNVFDFSGINFITNDYHNYYENSHYRPHVADYIMKEIYK